MQWMHSQDKSLTFLFLNAVREGDGTTARIMASDMPELLQAKDDKGLSVPMVAAYNKHPKLAQWLALHKAELNIYEACAAGLFPKITEILQEDESSLNRTAEDGFSPLMLSSYFGHYSITEYLIRLGADVNQRALNLMQISPIHAAVSSGHQAILELLLRAGADVNAPQMDGIRAIHTAAKQCNKDILLLLIRNKANVNIRMDDGRTALDYAIDSKCQPCVEIIKNAEGKQGKDIK